MCGFFKKLGEAVKEIDKYAKEIDKFAKDFDKDKEDSQEPSEEQTAPESGRNMKEILSLDEVARVTGLPFNNYNDYRDDMWKGGVYTCSDPTIHKHFNAYLVQKDPEGYDVDGTWNYLLEVMENPQPVQGIGDEAYWVTVTKGFFVRWGDNVLQASGGLSLNIIKQLVKIIIDKV